MSRAKYKEYDEINFEMSQYIPNDIEINSVSYQYWINALTERLYSKFDFDVLPENVKGNVKNYFYRMFFGRGYLMFSYNDKYGYFFAECGLKGFNFYRQPTECIVSNPFMNKTFTLGKDAELLLLRNRYMGAYDVICKYAVQLALIDTSINTSLINMKQPRILAARTEAGRQALKLVHDQVNSGNPLIIVDKLLTTDDDGNDAIYDLSPKDLRNNFITSDLLENYDTILKNFDREIGIPTTPGKKERLIVNESTLNSADGSARADSWFACIESSIEKIKELYPDIPLHCRLAYNMEEEGTKDGNNVENPAVRD